jgi:hypothetical protein
MRNILRNHAQGVSKCVLRKAKGDAVLFTVLPVFLGILLEFTVDHERTVAVYVPCGNIIVWLFIFLIIVATLPFSGGASAAYQARAWRNHPASRLAAKPV